MKAEHREAIEKAKLHGTSPMVFAHQLLVHDLVEAALFELRNIKVPFGRLGEDDQQEVIDRITKQAEEVVWTAVGIISSRSVDTIPIKIADSKFKEKNITVTGVVDAQDPNRHGLIDLSGKLALLVLAPNDYAEGLDGIRAERDQHELPLSASEIVAGMGIDRWHEQQMELAEQPDHDSDDAGDADDPLYESAVEFVRDTNSVAISLVQRQFSIGYNRAARLLDRMEADGYITSPNSNGNRELVATTQEPTPLSKEFGDFDYDDAKQLIVLKASGNRFEATWVQSRLAIGTDQVTTLLLRLLEDGVIEVVDEGASSLEHGYKVVATLAQVV